jgi:hypothetical protein
MTTPDAPEPWQAGGTDEAADAWETPSFVHVLSSGVSPSKDPVTLDADTAREVTRKLREIEDARASAAVSGRDYLIR